MAYHYATPAALPATTQPNQDVAQTQRVRQVQYIEGKAAQWHFASRHCRDYCPIGTVRNAAHAAQFGSFNSRRRGRLQAHHDLQKWHSRQLNRKQRCESP